VAQIALFAIPKRASFPSMLPPGCSALAVWLTPRSERVLFPDCSDATASNINGQVHNAISGNQALLIALIWAVVAVVNVAYARRPR